MREVERTGRVSFTHFYANRIRRLLPPAAVVLIVTVIVARIFGSLFQFKSHRHGRPVHRAFYLLQLPPGRRRASTTRTPTARSPRCSTSGPWPWRSSSTSLWPLLIGLRVDLRPPALAGPSGHRRPGGVVAVSLYFSITVTSSNAPLAYFSLHTRAWELGAGALIALGAARLCKPAAPVAIAGVLGRRRAHHRHRPVLHRRHRLPRLRRDLADPRLRPGHRRRLPAGQRLRRAGPGPPAHAGHRGRVLLLVPVALADR
jgi:hypothetical protein